MTRFEALTPDTATGAAKDMLADIVERHGSASRMLSTMAHSPAVLGGYLGLNKAMKRAKLDRRVSERISLAVQEVQGCALCLGAHERSARSLGVSEEEIALARKGTSADPAVAAMVEFGLRVYTSPATITGEQVAALRRHGYGDREIADVVGVVAINIMTGAFNLVAGLEPDQHDS